MPARGPMAAASRIRELEQRLQTMLGLSGHKCINISATTRICDHRQHGGPGAPSRRETRRPRPWAGAECVDGLGNPLRFILTGGQQHDMAEELIGRYWPTKGTMPRSFAAHPGTGYDAGQPRSNRKAPADLTAHRERHLVECFINKIKHYRRIFSRFEKLHQILGFLHFTAALIWLR